MNGVDVPGIFSMGTVVAKLIGVICAVAGSMPLGKEGPFVHIGAAMASLINDYGARHWRLLKVFKNDRDQRDLITCGVGAGVAGAFRRVQLGACAADLPSIGACCCFLLLCAAPAPSSHLCRPCTVRQIAHRGHAVRAGGDVERLAGAAALALLLHLRGRRVLCPLDDEVVRLGKLRLLEGRLHHLRDQERPGGTWGTLLRLDRMLLGHRVPPPQLRHSPPAVDMLSGPAPGISSLPLQTDFLFTELVPVVLVGVLGGLIGAGFSLVNGRINRWRRDYLHPRFGARGRIVEVLLSCLAVSTLHFALPLAWGCKPCPPGTQGKGERMRGHCALGRSQVVDELRPRIPSGALLLVRHPMRALSAPALPVGPCVWVAGTKAQDQSGGPRCRSVPWGGHWQIREHAVPS